jgi:hypothetical protein
MEIFRRPKRGISRILVLALAVFSWHLVCSPAFAELANDEAIFIDVNGDVDGNPACGIVSAESMSVVRWFSCEKNSEGIDVTSDGTRAVIGNCRTSTLTLIDLVSDPPVAVDQIDSGVRCVQELDIAPDDNFAIATGSANGLVSKLTLYPFAIVGTGGPWKPTDFMGGSPQDVHINSSGTLAVQPMYRVDFFAVLDITQDVPELVNSISTPIIPHLPDYSLVHQGLSLSQYDDDTFLATGIPNLNYITVASLSGLFEPVVLETPGRPESVDISCDGTRAVVETSEGLMWIDLEATPPVVLSENFGLARTDGDSTSTVAFSADGTLLFVAGGEQIDVYDVKPDLPVLRGSIGFQGEGKKVYSVATLPCSAASLEIKLAASEIEVAVDIEPRSCPNRLHVKSRGVLKVAILGSEDVDVMSVDPRTVQIEGVSPFNWKLKDAATPYDSDNMQGDCRDCTRKGRDGFLDLVLMFKRKDIAKVIEPAKDGDCLVLTLSGQTFEGEDILGDDVVRISTKKRNGKEWFKKFFFSVLKAQKKEKKNNSCTIKKKKAKLISKMQSQWHRFDKRH